MRTVRKEFKEKLTESVHISILQAAHVYAGVALLQRRRKLYRRKDPFDLQQRFENRTPETTITYNSDTICQSSIDNNIIGVLVHP